MVTLSHPGRVGEALGDEAGAGLTRARGQAEAGGIRARGRAEAGGTRARGQAEAGGTRARVGEARGVKRKRAGPGRGWVERKRVEPGRGWAERKRAAALYHEDDPHSPTFRIAMHLLDALNQSLPEVFRAIDLMGVLLNGILGGKVARERNFDAVGFCILAIMTALAGGMVRDMLLSTRTGAPVAITDPYYLWFAILGALIAMAFHMNSRAWSVLLVIADGMVLGCWSATGAIKTLDAGFAIMPAILLGVMTAIGGGMIRDISAGLVPRVFGGNNLYATPAFVCSVVTVVFWYMGQPVLGMGASIVVGLVFTGMAHWRRWRLPQTREWTITLTYSQLKALRRGRR